MRRRNERRRNENGVVGKKRAAILLRRDLINDPFEITRRRRRRSWKRVGRMNQKLNRVRTVREKLRWPVEIDRSRMKKGSSQFFFPFSLFFSIL
jgi:hypothetical protein